MQTDNRLTPSFFKKIRRRRFLLYCLIIVFLLPLSWTTAIQLVNHRFFDWFSTISPPALDETPVIIVGIDEHSFAAFNLQWPWPRELHADLIDSIRDAGAAIIAFDVVFSDPSNSSSDHKLAGAIKRTPSVVLASEYIIDETAQVEDWYMLREPLNDFMDSGAHHGLASVNLDIDGVLRKIPLIETPQQLPGFSLKIFQLWQQSKAIKTIDLTDNELLIQYFGGQRTYPFVSYYQALEPDKLPQDIFKDRIVIVGLALSASPEPGSRQPDTFETPFTLKDGQLTSGAEIQATIFDNLRLGLSIKPLNEWIQIILLAGIILLCWLLFYKWQPLRASLTALGLIVVVSVGIFLLLTYQRLWLPPTLMLTGIVIAYMSEMIIAFFYERSERQQIKLAFGHYLSPALVDQLAADPERLKLGGESRQMSIMFCDVRGFTTLSERFSDDPEGLTQLMNRFLTEMTSAVLDRGGTVDKYIGDCIMAFWNAPLNDPDHVKHACLAALDMFKKLSSLNDELAEQLSRDGHRLNLNIGLGINTGLCVVGNIGSQQRFDYSVLGDAVNLASRLEGLSKLYGVDIVLGEETAQTISDFALLELDLVAVKGKSQAVHIYTLIGDESVKKQAEFQSLAHHHSLMLQAYRQQNWDEAEKLLLNCHDTAFKLQVLYALYKQRIENFKNNPPEENWKGVYTAMTK